MKKWGPLVFDFSIVAAGATAAKICDMAFFNTGGDLLAAPSWQACAAGIATTGGLTLLSLALKGDPTVLSLLDDSDSLAGGNHNIPLETAMGICGVIAGITGALWAGDYMFFKMLEVSASPDVAGFFAGPHMAAIGALSFGGLGAVFGSVAGMFGMGPTVYTGIKMYQNLVSINSKPESPDLQ